MSLHTRVPIYGLADNAGVKGAIMAVSETIGLSETDRERALIAATELCTNLVRHAAGRSEIILGTFDSLTGRGIEIISLDRGPGMGDPWAMVEDGVSSRDRGGNGLGGVKRISSEFDIYSQPGAGTVVLARIAGKRSSAHHEVGDFQVGNVALPYPGEVVSGDEWATFQKRGWIRIMVCDGLGHGRGGAQAAKEVLRIFQENVQEPSLELIDRMHKGTRHTRGAAVSIAEIDKGERLLKFAGCGNISGLILGPGGLKRCMSSNGIVGHAMHTLRELTYKWPETGVFAIHTDGITSHWNLDDYPGFDSCHPAVIAAIAARDGLRGQDDATVVAVKEKN